MIYLSKEARALNIKMLSVSITFLTSLLSSSLVVLYSVNESMKIQEPVNKEKRIGPNQSDTVDYQTKIQGVTAIKQYPELPTGCEATTIAMMLNWAGIDIRKEDVAKALPKEPIPTYQNGEYIGGNPNVGFLGDPFSENGYGVLHEPVLHLLNQYLPEKAMNLTGTSFEKILSTVDLGIPVMVWVTRNLKEPILSDTWRDPRGNNIRWFTPQHTMLLTGYSQNEVIANDPETGLTTRYPRNLFQKRWIQMGSQAVAIFPSKHELVVHVRDNFERGEPSSRNTRY